MDGGLFGLLMGLGMFVFPIAGTLIVLGPLAGMIAGAVNGAGLGALVNGLMALGIPKDRALGRIVSIEGSRLRLPRAPQAALSSAGGVSYYRAIPETIA